MESLSFLPIPVNNKGFFCPSQVIGKLLLGANEINNQTQLLNVFPDTHPDYEGSFPERYSLHLLRWDNKPELLLLRMDCPRTLSREGTQFSNLFEKREKLMS